MEFEVQVKLPFIRRLNRNTNFSACGQSDGRFFLKLLNLHMVRDVLETG